MWGTDYSQSINQSIIDKPLNRQDHRAVRGRQGHVYRPSTRMQVQDFASERVNDSEKAWEKVMWPDETKLEHFDINSAWCVRR